MAIIYYFVVRFILLCIELLIKIAKFCFFEMDSAIVFISSYYGFKYFYPEMITDENVIGMFLILGFSGMAIYKLLLIFLAKKFPIFSTPLQFFLSLFSVFISLQYVMLKSPELSFTLNIFYFLKIFPSTILNLLINFLIVFLLAIFVFKTRCERLDLDYYIALEKALPFLPSFLKSKVEKTIYDNNFYEEDTYDSEEFNSYYSSYTSNDSYRTEEKYQQEEPKNSYPNSYLKACYILGCEPEDQIDTFKKSYKYLLKNFHPDKNSDEESTEYIKKINNAMDEIKKFHFGHF